MPERKLKNQIFGCGYVVEKKHKRNGCFLNAIK